MDQNSMNTNPFVMKPYDTGISSSGGNQDNTQPVKEPVVPPSPVPAVSIPPVNIPSPPISVGNPTPSPSAFASPPSAAGSINVMPKKENNKILPKILFIFLGILILAVLFFVGKQFLFKKPTPVKKVEINYWGLFEKPEVMAGVIADFETTHPNIKVNYSEENLFEYRERLQQRLSSQGGPDIFRIHQSWVPMLGNFLSPLPPVVYSNADFEKIFYPSAKESLNFGGKYVAVPLMVDGLALYYNEDIFKAAGKIPPTTWDELRKTAMELTVRDGEGKIRTAGVAMGTTTNVDHWSDLVGLLMLQNGADLKNPGACSKSSAESTVEDICPGADALSFYTIFSRNDRVWDSNLPSSTFAFATGLLAMYFGPSWRTFDIKNLNPNLNFKTLPVPQLPGRNIAWSTYWVEAVNKNSKNATEAWEFLKYLSSPEVLQKLYQDQSTIGNRIFGEPHPRTDMSSQLKDQPIIGSFIEQAPYAKSWYLSSATKDNGINDLMIAIYKEVVDSISDGRQDAVGALKSATPGITQILGKYTQSGNLQ